MNKIPSFFLLVCALCITACTALVEPKMVDQFEPAFDIPVHRIVIDGVDVWLTHPFLVVIDSIYPNEETGDTIFFGSSVEKPWHGHIEVINSVDVFGDEVRGGIVAVIAVGGPGHWVYHQWPEEVWTSADVARMAVPL